MAEVTDGQQLRIYTGRDTYYDLGIEKTGISRGSAAETVSGAKTFTGANSFSGNNTFSGGTQAFNTPVTFGATSGQILVVETTLTAAQIVGTAAGDLGHAAGATIIPAPGAGKIAQLLSLLLIYDFAVDAYGGGGDDLVAFYVASTTLTGAVLAGDLIGGSADGIVVLQPLAAAGLIALANTAIALKSTAWTNPGTAAGVLRVKATYRIFDTGL